ncbi:uncharacterized protein [Centruroides vittatus]|uniref:uncharacterized protein n=1 Tax=Centruroides vittatus TaxID=120091 RepID=UPI00350FCC4C
MEFISQDAQLNKEEGKMPEEQHLKSLLKKVHNRQSIRHRRVTFDDLVTYYTDDEVHVLSLRTPEVNDVFCMFEPPPEYQDHLPFEPPEGYKDSEDVSGDDTDNEREAPDWEEQMTSFVEEEGDDDGKDIKLDDIKIENEIRTDFGCTEENVSTDDEIVEASDSYDLELGLLKQLEEDSLDSELIYSELPNALESNDVPNTPESKEETVRSVETDEVVTSEAEVDSEDEDLKSAKGVIRTNSQIRRIMEKNAVTCTLLKGIEAKKRQVKRPKSPLLSTQSLVEQLKWLTSVDDDREKPSDYETANTDTRIQRTVKLTTVMPKLKDLARIQPLTKRNAFRAHFEQSLKHHATYGSVKYEANQSIRVIPGGNEKEQRIEIKLRQIKTRSQSPRCASDELERFVQQDLERIERIRKRYSVAEEDDDPTFGFARRPSVRGIRPRFGSTTEILKQIQTQLQSPPLQHNRPSDRHMIWTYANKRELHHMTIPANQIVSTDKKFIKDKRYYSHSENVSSWYEKERKLSNPFYLLDQTNQSTCQDERGTPEGASSSPKVSFDSLYPVEDGEQVKKDGVIYYSLNV